MSYSGNKSASLQEFKSKSKQQLILKLTFLQRQHENMEQELKRTRERDNHR